MDKCCFHFFESLQGRYPPCWVVRWVCSGMDGELHVFSRMLEMLFMSVSNEEHAFNHCILDRLLLFVKVEVRESIMFVFSSKKSVINWCAFSLGIGLRI